MQSILSVAQIVSGILMVFLILLQHGKGASMGSAFGGGGSSQTVFGAAGSFSFFAKVTAFLATIFFVSSMYLTVLNHHQVNKSVIEDIAPQTLIPQESSNKTPGIIPE